MKKRLMIILLIILSLPIKVLSQEDFNTNEIFQDHIGHFDTQQQQSIEKSLKLFQNLSGIDTYFIAVNSKEEIYTLTDKLYEESSIFDHYIVFAFIPNFDNKYDVIWINTGNLDSTFLKQFAIKNKLYAPMTINYVWPYYDSNSFTNRINSLSLYFLIHNIIIGIVTFSIITLIIKICIHFIKVKYQTKNNKTAINYYEDSQIIDYVSKKE